MSKLTDLLEVLSVQVEQASTGLRNLLSNPSGALGAWAWITDVGVLGTGSDVNGSYLDFTTAAVAQGPQSENIPVTPGQYLSASWYAIFKDGVYWSGAFWYYDSAGLFLSASPGTAYSTAIGQRVSLPPHLIPAGAVTARLRFTPSGTGVAGNVPAAGKHFRFREAVIATAATAAALGPTYTNRAVNPSFQHATHGWTVVASAGTLAVVSAGAGTTADRTSSLRVTRTGTGKIEVQSAEMAVIAGVTYSAGIWRSSTNGTARIQWYNAAHALLSFSTIATVTGGIPTQGNTALLDVVAPAGAAYARMWYSTSETLFYLDAWHLIDGAGLTYFDGSFADVPSTIDYSWTGTAELSMSTKSMSNLPYIPPITYQEIAGSSVGLKIERRTFDSTLSAVIRDAALDPLSASLLRPGRAVRVRVLSDETAAWESLFQGKIEKPSIDYGDLKANARPTIGITAYGPGSELVAAPKPYGVATIAELPAILEGVRIPFKVNGSTAQVSTSTVVSSNDSATALDQVVLARDSDLGYAWVNREGVLMAYEDRTLDYYGNGTATFAEDAYTGLGLGFDPDTIINSVSIILLRYNASTNETEEVAYGPYKDLTKIREWGKEYPGEFKVHGVADPAAHAALILAANATPQQRVSSLRVPIRDTADLTRDRALIDLYALANVVNTAKAVNLALRVQGITHTIDTGKRGGVRGRWDMDLSFTAEDTVAAAIPTTVPKGRDDKDGVWIEIGSAGAPAFQNGWSNVGGGAATAAYMRKNGVTYVKGYITGGVNGSPAFTIGAGFRPGQNTVWSGGRGGITSGAASTGTAHTHVIASPGARFDVGSNGNLTPQGANATGSIGIGCSYVAEA